MKLFFNLIFTICLLTFTAFGQAENGSLRGQVKDIADAIVIGATVSVTGEDGLERTSQTDQSGQFNFEDLPAGDYTVRAVNQGFAVYENPEVAIVPNSDVRLEIKLSLDVIETEVIVADENTVSTAPEANAGALVLSGEDIEALPDDEEDLEAALQALAGPSAGPNGGGIFIDGFSGGSLPPRDTIREIRINSNPFSSEFDRLGYGRIEILTKPGTDRLRGSVEFEFEDESLNSRNPFVADRPAFQRREFEARISGPIVKNRASFFVDFETENTDNNAFVNALVLDQNLNPVRTQFSAPSPSRDIGFNPRIDYQINDKNTLVFRYGFERDTRKNAGLGGFDLASRAFDRRETENDLRVTETAVISSRIINESRFQYNRRRSLQESADNSPTIRVLDAFTGGGANIGAAFSNEDRLELQNYTSFLFDKNTLKVGARIRNIKVDDSSPNNFAGTLTFTSIEQYRNAILGTALPTQLTIAGGNPQAGVSQTDVGIFAQNDWRVNPELTLSFGLRYENQSNISSNYNFAPRFGFAYAPGAGGQNNPKTVIRGGFGIFYDRFSENLTLQARRFNGTNQLRYIVTDPNILNTIIFTPDGGVSNVPTVGQLSAFVQPQTTRVVAPDLRAPYTAQFALSVERQLPFKTTFSATYVNARTDRLLRSRNINAPLNGIRPMPGDGNIFQYESTGRFRQNQLILNLRTQLKDISVFANYSLNNAESDTDGAGTFPADQFDLTGEFGRAGLDVRHRFVIGGSYNAPYGFRIRPFIIFRSGAPYNITTGTDSNGDSLFTERPTYTQLFERCNAIGLNSSFCNPTGISDPNQIIPRNYGTGPEFFIVNLRVSKAFGFGTRSGGSDNSAGGGGRRGGGYGGPYGGGGGRGGGRDGNDRFKVEFTTQIRNIFNRNNLNTPVGNLSSPFFGQSLSTAGGFGFGGGGSTAGNRRIELEVEFEF